MKSLPKIALVGRPNVGKSALFNCICKKRLAIVDASEGVTRDRHVCDVEFFGTRFEIVDTGGMDPFSSLPMNEAVRLQAEVAIEEADGIIFVVDLKVGLTQLDEEIARRLHRSSKPVVVAVNKTDLPKDEYLIYLFQSLGFTNYVAVSAAQNWQITELVEAALEKVPKGNEVGVERGLSLALVGRPNVGKSSLVNFLLSEERCLVSPMPGTTRDSIDVSFSCGGKPYTLIDTAGIRKGKVLHEVADVIALQRTRLAIDRADVCLLMLDANLGISAQDKRIAAEIRAAGKGCIVLLNKWDLVKGCRMEHCMRSLDEDVFFLRHCPKIAVSAKGGRNVEKIFPGVLDVAQAQSQRIETGHLNRFVEEMMSKYSPPSLRGKRLRIYYMTQVAVSPPRFVLFVNHPSLMARSYERYLHNQFRKRYGFAGSPIVFQVRGKDKRACKKVT